MNDNEQTIPAKPWYKSRGVVYPLVLVALSIARQYVNVPADAVFADQLTGLIMHAAEVAVDASMVFAGYKAVQGRVQADQPVYFRKPKEK